LILEGDQTSNTNKPWHLRISAGHFDSRLKELHLSISISLQWSTQTARSSSRYLTREYKIC